MPFTDESLNGYSPELINALLQAFGAVWSILYAHVPIEGDGAKELKIALSRTLVALAAEGITDAQELRRRALESTVLQPRN